MTDKETYLRLGQPLPKKILLEWQQGEYFKYYTLARLSDKTFSSEGPGEACLCRDRVLAYIGALETSQGWTRLVYTQLMEDPR